MSRLSGKVAVITGGSRGLGAGVAKAFANEGARVVVNYRANAGEAEKVVSEITGAGGEAIAFGADVSQREEVKELFSSAVEAFGKIDILVNNAGINQRCFFSEITDADWDSLMDVNLKGPFICTQEVFPIMSKNGGGRIINMSSVASQYHGPKTVHYAVSKAGLNSLTKVTARYGASENIIVNAVAPGVVPTEQTASEIEAQKEQIEASTLLGKLGRIEDVADACIFLASEEQQYVTGQVISVSGGAYLG